MIYVGIVKMLAMLCTSDTAYVEQKDVEGTVPTSATPEWCLCNARMSDAAHYEICHSGTTFDTTAHVTKYATSGVVSRSLRPLNFEAWIGVTAVATDRRSLLCSCFLVRRALLRARREMMCAPSRNGCTGGKKQGDGGS